MIEKLNFEYLLSVASGIVFVWRTSLAVAQIQFRLREQLAASECDRKLNEKHLECLQEELRSGLNGLESRFERFTHRSQAELSDLELRVRAVETSR